MSLNFNHTFGCAQFKQEAKENLYGALAEFTEKSLSARRTARLAGLPIAIISTTFEAVFCVADIAESAIKGLGNIFGALIQGKEGCSALKGVKQIVIEIPLKSAYYAIALPLHLVIGGTITTVTMLIAPVKYPRGMSNWHQKINGEYKKSLKELAETPWNGLGKRVAADSGMKYGIGYILVVGLKALFG